MIVVLARYLADRDRRLDSLAAIVGGVPHRDPAVGARPPAARPRDVARLHRGPRRDALHGRSEPALARRACRGDPGGPAPRLDLRAPRLPEGAPHELPGPGEGSAGRGLPAPDRPEGGELRRVPRGRPDERRRRASRACFRSSRPTSSLRSWPRSWASSGAWWSSCCSRALLWRILAIAWRSRDPFGLMMGAGVASMILFQITVNVGMVLGRDADHRHPAPVHHPRRRLAGQHRDRARHPPEHRHAPAARRVVTRPGTAVPAARYARQVDARHSISAPAPTSSIAAGMAGTSVEAHAA